jgi:hypothetical protein
MSSIKQFPVDDDLVALIWQRSEPQPFENVTFSEALRRVLTGVRSNDTSWRQSSAAKPPRSPEELLAELEAMEDEDLGRLQSYVTLRRQRAPSPPPEAWITRVPELHSITGLNSWKDICDHLRIEVGGDSARRKLRDWVRSNRPQWPTVPDA